MENITVAEERVTPALIEEMKALFELHWRELALYQEEIRLDPEYDDYLKLDAMGLIAPFMVRLDGAIIGYAVYFVRQNLHYRNHIWATADLFWVHPEHRSLGVGNALFEFVEKALFDRGANVMHTTTKEEHPAAAFLLTSRGHDKIENGFSKRLR